MFQFSHSDLVGRELLLPLRAATTCAPANDCPKWFPLIVGVVLGFYLALAALVLWMLL